MADEYSFDITSIVDMQSVDDAVNTANKEMAVRYDFRGSKSSLELDKKKEELKLFSDNEGKLKSVVDILQTRLFKRGVEFNALDFQKLETALGGTVRQTAKINQGISQEKAKAIVADIKSLKVKVTPSIQSDKIRVTSKSKDVLQTIIEKIKSKDYGIPLQFTNYR